MSPFHSADLGYGHGGERSPECGCISKQLSLNLKCTNGTIDYGKCRKFSACALPGQ